MRLPSAPAHQANDGTFGMTDGTERRLRRAARIILLDEADRVLLFRYTAPEYEPFWILPGGACGDGEDFPDAARRELMEETGIDAHPRPLGIVKQADYIYDGEPVRSVEHFFWCLAQTSLIDTSGHTELEQRVMLRHRWFSDGEFRNWPETIYPLDLRELLKDAIQSACEMPK